MVKGEGVLLTGIGESAPTSFITLYCHALEILSENPIISDLKSVEIITELNKTLSRSYHSLDRILASGRLDTKPVARIALRAKKYDTHTRDFLVKFPDGVIVNIGCGFDSRFRQCRSGPDRMSQGEIWFPAMRVLLVKTRFTGSVTIIYQERHLNVIFTQEGSW